MALLSNTAGALRALDSASGVSGVLNGRVAGTSTIPARVAKIPDWGPDADRRIVCATLQQRREQLQDLISTYEAWIEECLEQMREGGTEPSSPQDMCSVENVALMVQAAETAHGFLMDVETKLALLECDSA